MENKHYAVTIIGGVALAALVYFVAKRLLVPAPVQNMTPAATQTPVAAPPAAYTPVSTVYSPLPIGAVVPGVDGHATQLPPGISESSVVLPTVRPVKAVADPGTSFHDALSSVTPDTVHHDTTCPTTRGVQSMDSNAALIDQRYIALFGRHAEQAGLDYWSHAMATGEVTPATLDKNLTRGVEMARNPGSALQYLNGNG